MAAMPSIERVILITVERGGPSTIDGIQGLTGVEHLGISTRLRWWGLLSRVDLLLRMPFLLARLVKRERIDLLNAKGSLAGGIAHVVSRLAHVPYMVESFEPHSAYMVDAGVWSKHGLYSSVMRRLEALQKRHALFLVTVTQNYRDTLIAEGVDAARIKIIPSIVDLNQFAFDPSRRADIREEYGWKDCIVGVYVGKFGGLYYDREAFSIFEQARAVFGGRFRLLLLTNESAQNVNERLDLIGFPVELAEVHFVPHEQVPQWLSAADIAFSTIRYIPNGLYQSPVKDGEYWANGLPILLTTGVSDDHQIILREPWAGAIFDLGQPGSVQAALKHMADLFHAGVDRERIMGLAREYRSIDIARSVYAEIFDPPLPKA
ncbi:MAG: glycosyltransferase [Flavobacteriales bacterium]